MTAHAALWGWEPRDAFGAYYSPPDRREYWRRKRREKKERDGVPDKTTPEMLERIEKVRQYLEEHGPSPKNKVVRAAGTKRHEPLLTAATRELPLCEDDDGKLSLTNLVGFGRL